MMTPAQIQLIQSTIPVLRESGVALTSYFYQRMLKNHPELNDTFNLDHQRSGMQPRALAAAVLAYAENIENPTVLSKAIERISTKHVSLNIQADHYLIVGDNLLNSISEVLDVPMDSELIAAWKAAYLQLAELLISIEKSKYDALTAQTGGWTGWRNFTVSAITPSSNGKHIKLSAADGQAIAGAAAGDFISVRVAIANSELRQPQQFNLATAQSEHYEIEVIAEQQASESAVANTLLEHIQVGDIVEVSAPMQL